MVKFSRQDSHKKKKLGNSWRRPKGLQSKLRLRRKGYAIRLSSGYTNKNPKLKDFVVIDNLSDLMDVDKKLNIILSSKLGQRKKVSLLKKAKELGLNIINQKDVDAYIKSSEENLSERKKLRSEKLSRKEKKEKTVKKEKAKKESKGIEDKLSDKSETKTENTEKEKDKQKSEKDKVLTKKN